jgi:ribosomal protein L16 Arg81 hydroxylase
MRREGKTIEDAVDPGRIYAHFRAGKTLIHGGLNLTRPNLRALARSMTDRFAAKSEVVAFLTPAGQRGATHSDPTDVYVIQLEGTKRWQIWPTPQVRRPGDDKDSFDSLPDPVLDLSLQPGDVLYIPHNTPHRASAEGNVSLHVTVVAGPRTWAHHLLSAVQDILHSGPENRAADRQAPHGRHRSGTRARQAGRALLPWRAAGRVLPGNGGSRRHRRRYQTAGRRQRRDVP